jgi:hypothetical protein
MNFKGRFRVTEYRQLSPSDEALGQERFDSGRASDNHITGWYSCQPMKRIFRTRSFSRWMSKAGLTDYALRQAVSEMAQGLVDADLGGCVVKKRVALSGQGKRGGARTIVATRMADRWFFIYGFRKNERSTIDKDELRVLQEVARDLLGFDERQLEIALDAGEIVEVKHENSEA